MNGWEWFAATFPAGAVVSGSGVGLFVAAILSDRLFTKGQHLRIVNDLKAHHERERAIDAENHARELAEKDARLVDMRESREGYKEATAIERARADVATESLGAIDPTLKSILYVMESLDRALASPGGGA